MSRAPVIVWLRQDLRLTDHPALHAAAETGRPVIALYILDDSENQDWAAGGASRWWLHQSLASLAAELEAAGSRLILRRGASLETLKKIIRETQADTVYWNRLYEPAHIERDKAVKDALKKEGLTVESFNGSLLFEPWEVRNKQGGPYKVYTPYWNAVTSEDKVPAPLKRPAKFCAPLKWPVSEKLASFGLEPKIAWAEGFREIWEPGRKGAEKKLKAFGGGAVLDYSDERDRPDHYGTSRLSPHLHFGEISPREIWHALKKNPQTKPYLRQIIWREFAFHLLYHFPATVTEPLDAKFQKFPWKKNAAHLKAWQKGLTGYPVVDAGMRELWHTGWMHNRVRMIAASFLVKDLMLHWHEGARWFWDTLVDADLPNNTMGWQWVAGCGADAAPYFRVFNPVSQGEKFDPEGRYVRRWVPELAGMPDKFIHKPWQAPENILRLAGVRLGRDYPHPVVDHDIARRQALLAYESVKAPKS